MYYFLATAAFEIGFKAYIVPVPAPIAVCLRLELESLPLGVHSSISFGSVA